MFPMLKIAVPTNRPSAVSNYLDALARLEARGETGRDFDPDSEYTLALSKFVFTGGDGYTMFKEGDILEMIPLSESELLAKYIEVNLGGVIPEEYGEPLGRIRWVTSSH